MDTSRRESFLYQSKIDIDTLWLLAHESLTLLIHCLILEINFCQFKKYWKLFRYTDATQPNFYEIVCDICPIEYKYQGLDM